MERKDRKKGKVEPSRLKVSTPRAHEAFDGGARIHLSAKSIEDLRDLDAAGVVQRRLVDLKGMRVFVNRHRRRELRIKLASRSSDGDVDKIERGEPHLGGNLIVNARHCGFEAVDGAPLK